MYVNILLLNFNQQYVNIARVLPIVWHKVASTNDFHLTTTLKIMSRQNIYCNHGKCGMWAIAWTCMRPKMTILTIRFVYCTEKGETGGNHRVRSECCCRIYKYYVENTSVDTEKAISFSFEWMEIENTPPPPHTHTHLAGAQLLVSVSLDSWDPWL